jgi:hypothetical protein
MAQRFRRRHTFRRGSLFGSEQVRELQSGVRRSTIVLQPPLEGIDTSSGTLVRLDQGRLCEIALAKTGGSGIPARSGTTLGSATVTIQDVSLSNVVSAGNSVTCLNFSGSAIGNNRLISIGKRRDGRWQVLSEDCSGVA